MTDAELHALLRSAKPEMEFPPSFPAEVWRRIAVAEASGVSGTWGCWVETLLGWAAKPAGVVALCAAMIGGGLWLGGQSPPEEGTGRDSYLESVSPFAVAHRSLK